MSYIFEILPTLLKGCVMTLKLYAFTLVLSIPLGVILAIIKVSKIRPLRWLVGVYTWIFRGTPLLLQLFFTYYGLGIIAQNYNLQWLSFSPFAAATITFVINYSAYYTEIFRAGIESINKGQYEAAKALNIPPVKTFTRIILPQVIRRTLPPVSNEAIVLIKDTALVAAISLGELLRSSKEIMTRDMSVTPFILAGIIYLLISTLIVFLFKFLERKYSIYEREDS